MAKPTALDALNEALDLPGGSEAHADDSGTGAADDESGEADAEGDSDAGLGDDEGEGGDADAGADADEEGDGEEGAEEGAEEGEGEEVAEGEGERNPDGTFKKKDAKPDDKNQQQQQAGKKPDPINDPIPKNLSQETRERMVSLVKTAKELTTERDTIRNDFGTFVGGLQAANVSPEQYGETLSWLAMFNSGDRTQQEKALDLIEGIADRLSTMLGKERKLNDPLASHADLITAVQQGKVTKEYAQEIARTRNSAGFNRELQTNATNARNVEQAQAQELHTARTELHGLEETLRQTDPDYERKKAIIVPVLKPIMRDLPPKQWKAKFIEAYNAVKVGRAPNAGKQPGKNKGAPKNQPLRAGKQPAGGQARQAGSALDAMSAALANMGK